MRKFFTIALVMVTVFTAQVQSAGHINRRTNINVHRPVGFQFAPTLAFRRNLPIQRRFFVPRNNFFVPRRNLGSGFYQQLNAGFYGQTRLQRQLNAGFYSQGGFYQNADGFRGFAAQDPGLSTQSYEYHYVRSSAPLGAACSSAPLGAAQPACGCK